MKKMGELMKELGFNLKASDSAKEAFLKYLIKQSTGVIIQTPSEKKAISADPQKIIPFPQQLVFDFDDNQQKPATNKVSNKR
jgi:hypothetical protein